MTDQSVHLADLTNDEVQQINHLAVHTGASVEALLRFRATVRSAAADAARERARAIAGRPGDGSANPRYPVHGETRIHRAEGWYQAADWLETGKEPM